MIAELSAQERLLLLLRVEQAIARTFRLRKNPGMAAIAEALAEETAAHAKRLSWPPVWRLSEREISEILRERAGDPVDQAIELAREIGSSFASTQEDRLRRMK